MACQLLSSPGKTDFQAILDENDIEVRMKLVSELIIKEVQLKKANLEKLETLKKRFARQSGFSGMGDEEGKGEIDEICEKLDKLELPEEAKQICDREVKKLR